MKEVKIIRIDKVDSTNNYALQLLKDNHNYNTPTVVIACEQTSGRGQNANLWKSEAGKNLTFSIMCFPDFIKASMQFYLSKVICIGIAEWLHQQVQNTSIKWPNDIYIGDKKAGGILIENTIRAENIKHAIIGIGLNINQQTFNADIPNPVSLRQITGEFYDIDHCFEALYLSISKWYDMLRSNQKKNLNTINNTYLSYLYRYNVYAEFETTGCNPERFTARITSVDDFGRLQLLTANKSMRLFDFKEIKYIL